MRAIFDMSVRSLFGFAHCPNRAACCGDPKVEVTVFSRGPPRWVGPRILDQLADGMGREGDQPMCRLLGGLF